MRTDVPWYGSVWRRLGSAIVAALGIAAIVGSGGGFPDIDYDFDGPWAPSVSVEPAELTVQAGGTAVFSASAVGNFGEIYDRNIKPLGLSRGPNALWNKGGLMYPMPLD